MRAWIALAVLAAVAFSGCASEQGTVPVNAEPQTSGGNETVEPDLDVDNTTNQPPVAHLTADLLNGTAPLVVNLTIDGSDADGDLLSWVLSTNGTELANGTELPTNVSHTFDAGMHNITLLVTDGNVSAEAALVVNVMAAALPEDQTFTGSVTGAYAQGYTHDGVEHVYDLLSQPAKMTVHLSWARTDAAVDLDVYVYDPAGDEVAVGNNYNDPVLGDNAEEELIVIDDPDALSRMGEWVFSVISAGSVESDYTLSITFE